MGRPERRSATSKATGRLRGFIYDTFDAYAWLYVGSAAVGLGAALLAFAFPTRRLHLQAA